jgi:hypothetical protein
VLEDGVYDVLVVDAEEAGDGTRLELTVLAGHHKGEVVSLQRHGLGMDPLDCLGLPGTLTVADGQPSVVLDR